MMVCYSSQILVTVCPRIDVAYDYILEKDTREFGNPRFDSWALIIASPNTIFAS